MTDVIDGVNVILATVESAQADDATEAKLTSDIKSLWSAHRTNTATAKRTKEELEGLRLDLGWKLSEMKAILVRTGRSGGWSAYLRSQGIPRATAERNVKRFEALAKPESNCLNETICEPSPEDVRRLVRNILPRLRRLLTTPKGVAWFLEEVASQLQTADRGPTGGEVERAGPVATRGSCQLQGA
jgi:hypothetical protein